MPSAAADITQKDGKKQRSPSPASSSSAKATQNTKINGVADGSASGSSTSGANGPALNDGGGGGSSSGTSTGSAGGSSSSGGSSKDTAIPSSIPITSQKNGSSNSASLPFPLYEPDMRKLRLYTPHLQVEMPIIGATRGKKKGDGPRPTFEISSEKFAYPTWERCKVQRGSR